MRYKITHSTTYRYTERISTCHNQVHLAPRDTAHQTCQRHRVVVHPIPADRDKRLDYFGNHVEYFTILQPHTRLTVTSTSRVSVQAAPLDLSATPAWEKVAERLRRDRSRPLLDACQFVYASPRIPLTGGAFDAALSGGNGDKTARGATFVDEIRRYARRSFAAQSPLTQAVRDLTSRIHADIAFDARATTLNTPVQAAFQQRRGVCQEFAHVQIACLRSLGLAARYVSGYLRTDAPPGRPRLVGADVSHAWVSVFCGQLGWIDFDPTNDVVPAASHVTVAWGRDYDDVCPIQGVFLGGGEHSMTTSVEVAIQ